MYSEPRSESNRALEFVAVLAYLSYRGVAPDHRHDSFVPVAESLCRLPGDYCRNVLCTPFSRLLRHRCQLRQRFTVVPKDVRKIS
jgi:hypothetical protein